MSHPLVSKAVMFFFDELNKRGVSYAVLRKVEFIPDDLRGDIDILIGGDEKSAVLKVVHDCADKFDFKIYERRGVRGLYPILYKIIDEKVVFFRLDFTNPVKNSDELLKKRVQNEKGIYFLSQGLYEKKSKSNFKNILTYPFRFLFPPGKFIVVVGPDGVGKSTTAELVKQILEAFHIPVAHLHLGFRPNILPTKARILGRPALQSEKSRTPGLIRFFYHALDYLIGFFVRVRPLLVRGRIVLGERYYYNYLVDPRSQKELGFPRWLPRIIYNLFIPKPDIFILLSNDPEEIHKRRQEHSVEEIARQIEAYRGIGKKTKNFFEVETNKPASEVAMEMVGKISNL